MRKEESVSVCYLPHTGKIHDVACSSIPSGIPPHFTWTLSFCIKQVLHSDLI